jgi:LacI family transcriptional regulator
MTLVGNSVGPSKEQNIIKQMIQRDVDGIILLSTLGQQDHADLAFLDKCGIPLVLVDQKIEGLSASIVRGDNILGAMTIMNHLLSLGHQNIATVCLEKHSTFRDRMRGYQFSLMENGLQPDPSNMISMNNENDLYESVKRCFSRDNRPTALFLTGPNMAMPSIQALESLQLSIPDDVSVVVYDDTYGQFPEKYQEFFTSITQSGMLLGSMATDILLQQIRRPGLAIQEIVLPGTLNIRKSTRRVHASQG